MSIFGCKLKFHTQTTKSVISKCYASLVCEYVLNWGCRGSEMIMDIINPQLSKGVKTQLNTLNWIQK